MSHSKLQEDFGMPILESTLLDDMQGQLTEYCKEATSNSSIHSANSLEVQMVTPEKKKKRKKKKQQAEEEPTEEEQQQEEQQQEAEQQEEGKTASQCQELLKGKLDLMKVTTVDELNFFSCRFTDLVHIATGASGQRTRRRVLRKSVKLTRWLLETSLT